MTDPILKTIPPIMSVGLVGYNYKMFKKKKKKASDFVNMGVNDIIGLEFIKETSDLVGI